MKWLLLRTHYTHTETQGILLINDKFFGYTLEDTLRFTPKQPGKTCIPAGVYRVEIAFSPRFGKELVSILGVPGFTGIRVHGGNTHLDSAGCPLVAKYKGNGKIWGSLSGVLTKRLRGTKTPVWIEIINTLEI